MRALLIIDMLDDFIYGKLACKRLEEKIDNISNLLQYSRKISMPVIHVCDSHVPGIDREIKLWGEHAIEGTDGADIIPELKPKKGEYIIKKRRYTAFFDTGLETLLRELNVDELILTGGLTHICIQHTSADAFYRGYRIIIPSDCVDADNEENHKNGLEFMKKMYGAIIKNSREVIV